MEYYETLSNGEGVQLMFENLMKATFIAKYESQVEPAVRNTIKLTADNFIADQPKQRCCVC